jgi:hypothetical protein
MEIEVREGISLVFQVPMRAELGLGIGSPLSAGGAIMVACWREREAFVALDRATQQEVMSRVYMKRWLDDLLLVAMRRLSALAAAYVREQKGVYFYGPTLELKRV